MVTRFIQWASHWCHIFDNGIVRDFRVDLVLAAIGTLDDSIVCSIVGSAIGRELSLFRFFWEVDGRSVVAGTMRYIPLICFLAWL